MPRLEMILPPRHEVLAIDKRGRATLHDPTCPRLLDAEHLIDDHKGVVAPRCRCLRLPADPP